MVFSQSEGGKGMGIWRLRKFTNYQYSTAGSTHSRGGGADVRERFAQGDKKEGNLGDIVYFLFYKLFRSKS